MKRATRQNTAKSLKKEDGPQDVNQQANPTVSPRSPPSVPRLAHVTPARSPTNTTMTEEDRKPAARRDTSVMPVTPAPTTSVASTQHVTMVSGIKESPPLRKHALAKWKRKLEFAKKNANKTLNTFSKKFGNEKKNANPMCLP